MTNEEFIVKNVTEAQNGEFGVTAVKVECEAGLGRNLPVQIERDSDGDCVNCNEGQMDCRCCDGEPRQGYHECYCEGNDEDCEDCNGEGHYQCGDCEGTGVESCNRCNGNWHSDTPARNWRDNKVVNDFLLEHLSRYGLARKKRSTDSLSDVYGNWRPKKPLVYSKIYSDGGDTEWTFTQLIKEADKALLLPHYIEAFRALHEAIKADGGNPEIDITHAGMHMAFLNSPNGEYEWEFSDEDNDRYANFRKSMILLLPALYFLGSPDGNTRRLGAREPKIGGGMDKYSAIYAHEGALEFRVFDTCYQQPEQILDNLVVMCKAVRYWKTKYKRNHLDKVTDRVRFGIDGVSKVEQMYQTLEHIELLNRGLNLLKPEYRTIAELKKQRGFTVNKRKLNKDFKVFLKNVNTQYKEYERKFGWETVLDENNFINRAMLQRQQDGKSYPTPAEMKKIRREAKKYAKEQAKSRIKTTLENFTKTKTEDRERECGRWQLEVA